MNESSLVFFKFLNKFLDNLTIDNYSDETFNKLDTEFFNLVNNYNSNQVKAKSFFTFDQQLDPLSYVPRNQDFNKNYEFVFSGCSQTNGDHISLPLVPHGNYKNIWGFQISDYYDKESLNLGMGGQSAQSILKGLMNHFIKNGNPKVLLVLYPDFGRVEAVDSDKMKMEKALNKIEIIQHWYLSYSDDKRIDKISLMPHCPVNVLPWHFPLYHNLQSIMFLDQYCKQNNIYFKYSSWDYTSNIILKLLKNNLTEYSNYCEPDVLDFQKNCFNNLECHKDIKEYHPKDLWNAGVDKVHMGIHQHTHVKETFIKQMKKDNIWT